MYRLLYALNKAHVGHCLGHIASLLRRYLSSKQGRHHQLTGYGRVQAIASDKGNNNAVYT